MSLGVLLLIVCQGRREEVFPACDFDIDCGLERLLSLQDRIHHFQSYNRAVVLSYDIICHGTKSLMILVLLR